jgi:hypothetical protein
MVKNTVHVISLWYDCSSTPGGLIRKIVGVYSSLEKAQKECDKLNEKLTKEIMEDNDCETEDDFKHLSDFEYDRYDLSSPPEYSLDSFPVK